jgi:hypothetical protein
MGLHNLYTSPNVIRMIKSRRMRWTGHAAHIGEIRNAYKILVGKPDGKRQLGGSKCRWEDFRMDFREIGWQGVDLMYPAEDREQWRALVNTVMNLRIP